MRYFTSDTHFGHERIIELCNRPFASVRDMNEALIANWNSVVDHDDEVFHLGDVALGPWVEWDSILTRLNGYKILVIGNHDRIFAGMPQKQQDKFIEHYNRWFDDYYDNLESAVEIGDTVFNLSHFPYDGDSHGDDRYNEFRLHDNGTPLIHGHTHKNLRGTYSAKSTPQIHVGVDAWDYRPVSEAEILGVMGTFL